MQTGITWGNKRIGCLPLSMNSHTLVLTEVRGVVHYTVSEDFFRGIEGKGLADGQISYEQRGVSQRFWDKGPETAAYKYILALWYPFKNHCAI